MANRSFSSELNALVHRSRLPLRRIAERADFPHQTLFNWISGTQPRWHPGLDADIRRLAQALALDEGETERLLQAAGCLPYRPPSNEEDPNMPVRALPKHWFPSGMNPADYDMGVSDEGTADVERYAFVRSRRASNGFGTLMQTFLATEFRGKRLQFRAQVSTNAVNHWAALWMRVDGPAPNEMLAFDNMQDRPITGTTEWRDYSLVLDVAQTAKEIAFGLLLAGTGEVRMANIEVNVVGPDVPTTGGNHPPPAPMNLSLPE